MQFDPNEDYTNWLAEGEHTAVVITAHSNGSSGTGTPYIEFTFDNGRATHDERFYLTAKSLWKLKALFSAIGCKEKVDLDVESVVRFHLYNKPLSIVIFKDGEYRKIKSMGPAKGAVTKREESREEPGRHDAPPPDDDDLPF